MTVFRRYVLPKEGENIFGAEVFQRIEQVLGITTVSEVVQGVVYEVEGVEAQDMPTLEARVLGEAPLQVVLQEGEIVELAGDAWVLVVEALPGQYDQRADFAAQCAQLTLGGEKPVVRTADVYIVRGALTDEHKHKITSMLVNPLDTRAVELSSPLGVTNDEAWAYTPGQIADAAPVNGFRAMSATDLTALRSTLGLAMTQEDLEAIQRYFIDVDREPTQTELMVLDMYWSDHCRHTTFLTELTEVKIDNTVVMQNGEMLPDVAMQDLQADIHETLQMYLSGRKAVNRTKPVTLMDLATAAARELRAAGKLDDLEESDEVNAASIVVDVKFEDGSSEPWLFQFKNETHNHPTEISPFGGAATALGGCIRDPMSGRAYVFFGVRYVGGGDPTEPLDATLAGKLPQRQIHTEAAEGFAAYGNQIGVPTLHQEMLVHPGYRAKRFCCGAVGAATPVSEVRREGPKVGDKIVFVGGRTGRDGVGGATGSSKSHDQTAVETASAEVQKGNPPEERALMRLFDRPEAKALIKKCNDFGAGGVTNAVGEMADGVHIYLERLPLKYAGLTPGEMALSESQERMAVLVDAQDAEQFIMLADEENLEAVVVADVTDARELRVTYMDEDICRLGRDLMDGGWAERTQTVQVSAGAPLPATETASDWMQVVQDLNVCSKRAMQERFDSCVGGNTLQQPYGGTTQKAPSVGAVSLFPVGGTTTAAVMTCGYDPVLSQHNPYLGGMMAVVESIAKIVALGGNPRRARLTLQNYFQRLEGDASTWGLPLAMQLGAYRAQTELVAPAIGGKDSMSGTFTNPDADVRIDVPPTLVSFAVTSLEQDQVLPGHFTDTGGSIVLLPVPTTPAGVPDWTQLRDQWKAIHTLTKKGHVQAARTVGRGGVAAALTMMMAGETYGAKLVADNVNWTQNRWGDLLLVVDTKGAAALKNVGGTILGVVQSDPVCVLPDGTTYDVPTLVEAWESPLDGVFARTPEQQEVETPERTPIERPMATCVRTMGTPKVAVPIFLGTNCEYETARAFGLAGAEPEVMPFRNKTPEALEESLVQLASMLNESQILMLSGGFSAGDQPGGAGKFIANVLRSPRVADAVSRLLGRGGLVLGVCNGFQALVKSGLLPDGTLHGQKADSPTLTWNRSGHFMCRSAWHKVCATHSPWMNGYELGEVVSIPLAHGEGRFTAPQDRVDELWEGGQVAWQYSDAAGTPGRAYPHNPNGSVEAIGGITDASGHILGMMGHPERAIGQVRANTPFANKGLTLFQGGVNYFL